MKNRVEVSICGNRYTVMAEEPKDYILKVADYVDSAMRQMILDNPSLSTTMAAVLTAINICDEYFRVKGSTDNMRDQLQKYIDDAAAARNECRDAQIEIMRLRSEIKDMKRQLPETNLPKDSQITF